MKVLASIINQPWFILILIIIIFGLIAAGVFLFRKYFLHKGKEEKPSDEEIAEEELNRYLVDVDDENQQKEFDNINEKNDKDNESKSE